MAIKTFILFCLTGLYLNCQGQENDALIKHIRASYQKINADEGLKKLELDNDEFLPEAYDGGCSLIAYYKNNTIYKLKVWVGLSYCNRQYKYYFENQQPFFIYET